MLRSEQTRLMPGLLPPLPSQTCLTITACHGWVVLQPQNGTELPSNPISFSHTAANPGWRAHCRGTALMHVSDESDVGWDGKHKLQNDAESHGRSQQISKEKGWSVPGEGICHSLLPKTWTVRLDSPCQ